MITIFTTAKPFTGKARISQYNALKSWKALHSDIEVILFGSGEGYEEAAGKLGLVLMSDVDTSEKGTPLVNSMFALAQKRGKYDIQAYVNCDIILMKDFIKAAKRIKMKRFMMVGQRWDLNLDREIDFEDEDWERTLKEKVGQDGSLMAPSGIDYFLFRRGIWGGIPNMVVGRAGYDNYLIYYCRANGIPVVDATEMVTAVHQNHDYSHLKQGKQEAWSGVEALKNIELAGGYDHIFTIEDADWCLTSGSLVRNYCRGDRLRSLEVRLLLLGSTWVKPLLFLVGLVRYASKKRNVIF